MRKLFIVISATSLLIFTAFRLTQPKGNAEKRVASFSLRSQVSTSSKLNYTIEKCLERFKSEQEFLDLVYTAPNVTDETKLLADADGALMSGDKIIDSKIGQIDPNTDQNSATIGEIRAALRMRENLNKTAN
ncbi:MAG: hypothetical protein LBI13_03580 [Streptococcaceae bacterium]|jgi:hypothetical protein|nr:hypothetical protein [Streptococcaceae bacterium]